MSTEITTNGQLYSTAGDGNITYSIRSLRCNHTLGSGSFGSCLISSIYNRRPKSKVRNDPMTEVTRAKRLSFSFSPTANRCWWTRTCEIVNAMQMVSVVNLFDCLFMGERLDDRWSDFEYICIDLVPTNFHWIYHISTAFFFFAWCFVIEIRSEQWLRWDVKTKRVYFYRHENHYSIATIKFPMKINKLFIFTISFEQIKCKLFRFYSVVFEWKTLINCITIYSLRIESDKKRVSGHAKLSIFFLNKRRRNENRINFFTFVGTLELRDNGKEHVKHAKRKRGKKCLWRSIIKWHPETFPSCTLLIFVLSNRTPHTRILRVSCEVWSSQKYARLARTSVGWTKWNVEDRAKECVSSRAVQQSMSAHQRKHISGDSQSSFYLVN